MNKINISHWQIVTCPTVICRGIGGFAGHGETLPFRHCDWVFPHRKRASNSNLMFVRYFTHTITTDRYYYHLGSIRSIAENFGKPDFGCRRHLLQLDLFYRPALYP